MKKEYRNVFVEAGIPADKVENRLKEVVEQFFKGEDSFYHETEDGMGYFEDTGNFDARTEGMSYGMMMCVQLDMKEEFDRIWKWAKTYMYMDTGFNEGYFAWSCATDGTKNADGPAPDGEEFFAMALFFASHRWGDGEGIFDYSSQAKEILRACIHKGENGRVGTPMWNRDNFQILFVPGIDYTDPSYHLPHFYRLFAEWAYEEDRPFLAQAAKASREYLHTACHPETGMSAEYAEYDGTAHKPINDYDMFGGRHDWFYSDAYRTMANIGLDYAWFGKDEWQREIAGKLQSYFYPNLETGVYQTYEVDGTPLEQPALHPIGLLATNAQASLASDFEKSMEFVQKFWDTPLREGGRRYYDNCLYFFAMMALSGNYRIW